jgi:hypothetical protein
MTQDDFTDVEHLVEAFDIAITSDNPLVKDALRQLLVATALTSGNNRSKIVDGPLKKLLLMLTHMDGRISALERRQWTGLAQAKDSLIEK